MTFKAMNTLNIDNINRKSPYLVTREADSVFYFYTDHGVGYNIVIKPNDIFLPSGAFVLDIINIWNVTSPGDPKLKQTLIAIVEEFFSQNNDVMLYVTETKDKKQAFRNRLFLRWFNTYENKKCFFIKTAEGKMDGKVNFMAMISRKDNPNLQMAILEFDDTVSFLFD